MRILRKEGTLGLQESELPRPPKHHGELSRHPLGDLFLKAEEEHLLSHERMKSWQKRRRVHLRRAQKQILDCMWVYVCKCDTQSRLKRVKARLVVRGDQQKKSLLEETYASTLAARSFRTLIAIAARFDLELIQYDAVNAFVNAELKEEIYMRSPPGHGSYNEVLKLNKALYGLRKSPLLWQRELVGTLKSLGFEAIPEEPCILFSRKASLCFTMWMTLCLPTGRNMSRRLRKSPRNSGANMS